ncbi:MAG: FapA family protein [Desulfurivibrio sp.]|nr:FapA family protein [Desulfurivibrio sp.]
METAAWRNLVLPRVVIARGKEPVAGRDAHIEMLTRIEKSAGRLFGPTERIDFRERDTIQSVKKGDVLARRTPPEPGQDGYTVQGQPLVAKPGSDLQFQPQPNVVISEDGCRLLADIDGMITVLAPNKIAVFEAYEVKEDVDYHVGNLEMVGTLLIKGWVRSGFTLRASGDIRVAGGVENAVLDAGGNVEIGGGMVARGGGSIKAGGNVAARFLEWTRVKAGGSITVQDQVMRCQLFAAQGLTVTGGRGRIRGGMASAIQGIEANELGSPAGVRTVLMAGTNPALRRRLARLDKQLAEHVRQRAKLDTVLGRWFKQGRVGGQPPPEVRSRLSRLAKQRRALVQAENRLRRPQQQLQQELAAIDLEKIKVVAHKAVYAGTVVVIGQLKHQVRDDLPRPVTFRLDAQKRAIDAN